MSVPPPFLPQIPLRLTPSRARMSGMTRAFGGLTPSWAITPADLTTPDGDPIPDPPMMGLDLGDRTTMQPLDVRAKELAQGQNKHRPYVPKWTPPSPPPKDDDTAPGMSWMPVMVVVMAVMVFKD